MNTIRIDPSLHDHLDHLAPGVIGYTIDHDGELWIPLIYSENHGEGDVGRYLDGLPRDRRVVVPNVLNPRLAEMLKRRGFHLESLPLDDDERAALGDVDAYVRDQ